MDNKSKITLVIDIFYNIIEIICKILIVLMVIVISYTVFGRFVLNKTPSWGEELGILCMVWIALLSAALAVRDDRHIRMTIINLIVGDKIGKLFHKAAYGIILTVSIILIIHGVKVTQLANLSRMSALGISNSFLFAALPASGIAMLIMIIEKVVKKKWK